MLGNNYFVHVYALKNVDLPIPFIFCLLGQAISFAVNGLNIKKTQ